MERLVFGLAHTDLYATYTHFTYSIYVIITHAGIAAGVGRAFCRICQSVCLFVCALTGKRLKQHQTWYMYTL